MKYTILALLLSNTYAFSCGFIKNPRIINPRIINLSIKNIKMSNIPDYDPSQIINSLAKNADVLDKWNLNDFFGLFGL